MKATLQYRNLRRHYNSRIDLPGPSEETPGETSQFSILGSTAYCSNWEQSLREVVLSALREVLDKKETDKPRCNWCGPFAIKRRFLFWLCSTTWRHWCLLSPRSLGWQEEVHSSGIGALSWHQTTVFKISHFKMSSVSFFRQPLFGDINHHHTVVSQFSKGRKTNISTQ